MWKPTFKFSRGPMKNQVTSDRMNHILDGVKMAQPSASGHVGMTVNQTPDGWVAKVKSSKNTSPINPWKTTRNDDGATKRVSIRPGTINSLVPTDIFSPITITGTGVEYIVLTMTSTWDSPVSASLSKETTYPVPSATTPSNPPTAVTDVLAVVNDGIVYQIRSTNLVATSLEVYQETVATPAVGERQYIPWYRWEVGES
jgi:hypothetical protein